MKKPSLGKRIKFLREKRGLNQKEFAAILNVQNSTLSQYESDARVPSDEIKLHIAEYFNVSLDYLFGRLESATPYTHEDNLCHKQAQHLPVLSTIHAGLSVLAEDNWDEQISVSDYLDADYALRINDDSMKWAGINEGDLALMEQISTASHGQIVAAGVEAFEWQATLKFFIEENGGYKLRSANPEYEDIVFSSQHRIIGRLIRVVKEAPSLYDYKSMVISKEILDPDWQNAIMKAYEIGLDGKNIQSLIEMFASAVRKIR